MKESKNRRKLYIASVVDHKLSPPNPIGNGAATLPKRTTVKRRTQLNPVISHPKFKNAPKPPNSTRRPIKIAECSPRTNLSVKFSFSSTASASKSINSPVHSQLAHKLRTKFDMLNELPMPAAVAFTKFQETLTDYERDEIFSYNEVFYIGNYESKWRSPSDENHGFDEPGGGYILYRGDQIGYRYEILDILGVGSFGKVCKAYDHKAKELCAIKIIKNVPSFYDQGQIELSILKTLNDWDIHDNKPIVKCKEHFIFRRHLCLVFELLEKSIYDVLKLSAFVGMGTDSVKQITRQVLQGLDYIRKHQIIHCDLKPENILFLAKSGVSVKLIDFGSSCFTHQAIYTYIQSRFYRAPEIILGISYSTGIDMWSLGCMVYEMATGRPLFPGSNEHEQIILYIDVLGLPPPHVLQKSRRKSQFFAEDGSVLVYKTRCSPISLDVLRGQCAGLVDFLQNCLYWDYKQRMSPQAALQHPFLKE